MLARLTRGREANNQTPARVTAPAQEMKIARLTANGKVQTAAISPDGKFLGYVENEGDTQSLWTKQIATNSNLQLVPPAEVSYSNLTFTPDGNYIYYAAKDQTADKLLSLSHSNLRRHACQNIGRGRPGGFVFAGRPAVCFCEV